MPLYRISTQEGTLSPNAKSALATEITEFHCALTDMDKRSVKVIFNTFPQGDAFVGGASAAAAILTVFVRSGRLTDYKESMATRLWAILKRATGAPDAAIVVSIQDAPPSQDTEAGKITPEAVTGTGWEFFKRSAASAIRVAGGAP